MYIYIYIYMRIHIVPVHNHTRIYMYTYTYTLIRKYTILYLLAVTNIHRHGHIRILIVIFCIHMYTDYRDLHLYLDKDIFMHHALLPACIVMSTWVLLIYNLLWFARNHEAWHEGSETRIVLIVDIWHPDLSDAEALHGRGSVVECHSEARF